jgi:hypothetical protein
VYHFVSTTLPTLLPALGQGGEDSDSIACSLWRSLTLFAISSPLLITGKESIRPAVEAKAKPVNSLTEKDKSQRKRLFASDGFGRDASDAGDDQLQSLLLPHAMACHVRQCTHVHQSASIILPQR